MVIVSLVRGPYNFLYLVKKIVFAVFIAEGGPDCLNASSSGIKTCVESVFGQKIEGDTPTLDSLPLLLLKTEECEYVNFSSK